MKKIIKLIPILIIITIVFELSNISFATTDEKKSTISIILFYLEFRTYLQKLQFQPNIV